MKKILFTLFAVSMTTLSVSAQQQKSGELDSVGMMKIAGNIETTYIPSDVNKFEIDFNGGDANKFKWTHKDGVLDIQTRPNSTTRAKLTIWAKMEDIQNITVIDGEFVCDKVLEIPMLTVSMQAKARTSIKVNCQDLELEGATSAQVKVQGSAKYLDVKSKEGARVDAKDVTSVSVSVDATTNGEVFVAPSERLVAYPKSGAMIYYKGDPVILKSKSSAIGMGAGVQKLK